MDRHVSSGKNTENSPEVFYITKEQDTVGPNVLPYITEMSRLIKSEEFPKISTHCTQLDK